MKEKDSKHFRFMVEELSNKISGNHAAMLAVEIAAEEGPYTTKGYLPAINYLNNEMATLTKALSDLVESCSNHGEEAPSLKNALNTGSGNNFNELRDVKAL